MMRYDDIYGDYISIYKDASDMVAPSRYGDRPTDWRTQLAGAGGTALVLLLVFGATFLTWQAVQLVRQPSEPLVVSLQPLSSPEIAQEVPEGPVQVEQQPAERHPPADAPPPSPSPLQNIPREQTQSEPTVDPSPPVKPVAQTSAPNSIPAPPAPQLSSNTSITWEAQVLTHLEKYRRYPAAARARRQQGVVHVRFKMNRAGRLLSSEILRSSGSPALDRAALDTVRRAQPLPAIPPEKPDPLELTTPVEFFVR